VTQTLGPSTSKKKPEKP